MKLVFNLELKSRLTHKLSIHNLKDKLNQKSIQTEHSKQNIPNRIFQK
jgi:hypothetical protein